jgi:proliferating cell nuclear antigen
LKLEAAKFDYFKCSAPIVIGVNILNLFKIIKTASNEDTLSFFITDAEPNDLQIRLENSTKKKMSTKRLKLIDFDGDNINIPPSEFECEISMPSLEFQKVCRDQSVLSEVIEIKSVGNKLIFSCHGDIADDETVFGEKSEGDADGLKYDKTGDSTKIIQGYYNLKHLMMFSKCAGLCGNIKILMKNDFPIIIAYQVGNLGTLRLALAPKNMDNN